jgi:hypothetical protein
MSRHVLPLSCAVVLATILGCDPEGRPIPLDDSTSMSPTCDDEGDDEYEPTPATLDMGGADDDPDPDEVCTGPLPGGVEVLDSVGEPVTDPALQLVYRGVVRFRMPDGREGAMRVEIAPDGSTTIEHEIDDIIVTGTRREEASQQTLQFSAPDLSDEDAALLMSPILAEQALADLAAVGLDPLGFDCSDFGKSAVQGFKYAFKGSFYLLGSACCLEGGPLCLPCATGAGIGADAVGDALDDFCD